MNKSDAKYFIKKWLLYKIGSNEEENHDDGHNEEGNLQSLLQFSTDLDGTKAALLETSRTTFMMMMVVMVVRH